MKNRGITLIALIITIIVLVILAAVSINMVLGENGLFNKAKTSVAKYENAQERENDALARYENEIDNARENNSELKAVILEMVYPVGSIYASKEDRDPSTFIGGKWKRISQGRVLMGEGTLGDKTYTAGTTEEAGLPNITGQLGAISVYTRTGNTESGSGALYDGSISSGYAVDSYSASGWDRVNNFYFNAARSNAIYGASNTVQPPAYIVYMWERTE